MQTVIRISLFEVTSEMVEVQSSSTTVNVQIESREHEAEVRNQFMIFTVFRTNFVRRYEIPSLLLLFLKSTWIFKVTRQPSLFKVYFTPRSSFVPLQWFLMDN